MWMYLCAKIFKGPAILKFMIYDFQFQPSFSVMI